MRRSLLAVARCARVSRPGTPHHSARRRAGPLSRERCPPRQSGFVLVLSPQGGARARNRIVAAFSRVGVGLVTLHRITRCMCVRLRRADPASSVARSARVSRPRPVSPDSCWCSAQRWWRVGADPGSGSRGFRRREPRAQRGPQGRYSNCRGREAPVLRLIPMTRPAGPTQLIHGDVVSALRACSIS